MNPDQQAEWRDVALAEVLRAVVSDSDLRAGLIFKGARILNRHLETQRQSLDLDSNLTVEFRRAHPDRREQAAWFEANLERALPRFFESQDPVRYSVESVTVENRPARVPHEFGWDGLVAKFHVRDAQWQGARHLPALEIDIAAPETLGEGAVCELDLDGSHVRAYTLHRIAGEKLRAFLTSLPAYRGKLNTRERVARAKDLFDLARILAVRPLTDEAFWDGVAGEFVLACESRYVDCDGLATFREDWKRTEQSYRSDATLEAISWSEAETALTKIVGDLDRRGLFPLRYPLPEMPDPAA